MTAFSKSVVEEVGDGEDFGVSGIFDSVEDAGLSGRSANVTDETGLAMLCSCSCTSKSGDSMVGMEAGRCDGSRGSEA